MRKTRLPGARKEEQKVLNMNGIRLKMAATQKQRTETEEKGLKKRNKEKRTEGKSAGKVSRKNARTTSTGKAVWFWL